MNDGSAEDSLHRRPLMLRGVNLKAGDHVLLTETSVAIPGGEITVIVGGSGAGKSVLLKTLAGLLPRQGEAISWSGTISLADQPGEESAGDADTDPVDLQHRVGIVFQQFALFDELSPTANVQFAIDHRSDRSKPPLQSAVQWLEELGVPKKTPIAGLSGGQKQRLAIGGHA